VRGESSNLLMRYKRFGMAGNGQKRGRRTTRQVLGKNAKELREREGESGLGRKKARRTCRPVGQKNGLEDGAMENYNHLNSRQKRKRM